MCEKKRANEVRRSEKRHVKEMNIYVTETCLEERCQTDEYM